MNPKIITLGLFIFTLVSCDCVIKVNGKVIDKTTGNPVNKASVKLFNGRALTETSENGSFELKEVTGFCKDPVIQVNTPGYLPFQLRIKKENNQTVYSVKSELYWMKFDKPQFPDTTNKKTFFIGTWLEKWSQDFAFKDSLIIYLTRDSLTKNK